MDHGKTAGKNEEIPCQTTIHNIEEEYHRNEKAAQAQGDYMKKDPSGLEREGLNGITESEEDTDQYNDYWKKAPHDVRDVKAQ